jgi:hypothetical protein
MSPRTSRTFSLVSGLAAHPLLRVVLALGHRSVALARAVIPGDARVA